MSVIDVGRLNAYRILMELFSEEVLGVDQNGHEISSEKNAHFLACARSAVPNLPNATEMKLWQKDLNLLDNTHWKARYIFAVFLHQLADGIMEKPEETKNEI